MPLGEAWVVERFGKYSRTLTEGIFITIDGCDFIFSLTMSSAAVVLSIFQAIFTISKFIHQQNISTNSQ